MWAAFGWPNHPRAVREADQLANRGHGLRLAPLGRDRSGPCPRQPHGASEAIDRLDPLGRP